jgi:multidrug efflux pump subunit AcrB
MNQNKRFKGAIGWFINNPVAANMLILFLIIGGFYYSTTIKQEVFPEFSLDSVVVEVSYPQASPEDIEKGILLPIEEAVEGIDGIEKVTSVAKEGLGKVIIEASTGTNINQLYQDVKSEIDRIRTFPKDAEDPTVYIPSRKKEVIELIIYGNQNEKIIKKTAEFIKSELLSNDEITYVDYLGEKPYEVSIEISSDTLKKYNITLSDVANKIKEFNMEIPTGNIKTHNGDILIRLTERKEYAKNMKNIPIISTKDGGVVTLSDIATIKDTFEDTETFLKYNNMPAIGLRVYRVGNQKPIEVAQIVKNEINRLNKQLPNGIRITYKNDRSQVFKDRISLLLRNARLGLILVFALLAIFLEVRLAFWVMLGIPVSFLGSMLLFPQFDVSINMISLFAFIITLGIVVDDAIVVGENIYRYRQNGDKFFDAAYKGAKEMAIPVTFSVITNIVAFLPMYFVPGVAGKIFRIIPIIVLSVFVISLLESLFILPSHIAHQKEQPIAFFRFINRFQQKVSIFILNFINNVYGPILKFCIKFRYIILALSISVFLVSLGYVKGGHIGVVMFPKVESDFAYAKFSLPVDSSTKSSLDILDTLTKKAQKVINENGKDKLSNGILSYVNHNTGWIQVYLTEDPDARPITTGEFVNRWRDISKGIAGVKSMQFYSDFGGPGHGSSITVELQHENMLTLKKASRELADYLKTFSFVSGVDDGFNEGKVQYDIKINKLGKALNITTSYIGKQLRDYYYGAEAKRFLRGVNEVKIMVRADESERELKYFFDHFLIMLPNGEKIPLESVATVKKSRSYLSITRNNSKRVINVTANTNPSNMASVVLDNLKGGFLNKLKEKYPGLGYSFEGKQSDLRDSMSSLFKGLIVAVMAIYVILSIPLKSYIQPIIIMFVIPFGIIGAIFGHILLGYDLSLVSMFGIVALSGVVVNDSLVLIDFANRKREQGTNFYSSIIEAGLKRFRAIILTTLTTFFGLMPMIFEKSIQAKFLIPMAISLGFGILFSTFIVLILIPGIYVIVEDIAKIWKILFSKNKTEI